MKCNLGKNDRFFRVILGIIVIGLGVEFKSWLGIVGLIPLLTAVIGFCPAYVLFNFSTCKCDGDCCCGDKKTDKSK
ncbi:MAG: DUF2892 domain-containing protein [Candidatus Riflemargulisbacteria bacterium]